jgi:upstream activation factor subunit UAF30
MAKAAKKAAAKAPAKSPKKAATKAAVTPKKAAAKAPKKAAKGKNGGGAANAAFMAPLSISSTLADVVGSNSLPRTEIIKKIWDYIKANNLQDAKNRRMINADDKLLKVFNGTKQVSMFELAKIVNNHVNK